MGTTASHLHAHRLKHPAHSDAGLACAPQPQHCALHGRERAARSDWQCIGLSTRSISHDYDSSLRALIEYHRERGSTWFSDRLHRLFCTMARVEQSPLKHR